MLSTTFSNIAAFATNAAFFVIIVATLVAATEWLVHTIKYRTVVAHSGPFGITTTTSIPDLPFHRLPPVTGLTLFYALFTTVIFQLSPFHWFDGPLSPSALSPLPHGIAYFFGPTGLNLERLVEVP